jgi:hypothetical protein
MGLVGGVRLPPFGGKARGRLFVSVRGDGPFEMQERAFGKDAQAGLAIAEDISHLSGECWQEDKGRFEGVGRIFIGDEALNTAQREEALEGSEGRSRQGCVEIGGEGFEVGDDGAALHNEMGKRVVAVAVEGGVEGHVVSTAIDDAADAGGDGGEGFLRGHRDNLPLAGTTKPAHTPIVTAWGWASIGASRAKCLPTDAIEKGCQVMTATIPAISVRQPWAHAIVHLGKDIENRSRRSHYRGPLLIHAGLNLTRDALMRGLGWIDDNVGPIWRETPTSLERGGIVGIVDVVDCVEESDSPWFGGPFGLVLANPRPLSFVPYKGQLGMFKVPPELVGQ